MNKAESAGQSRLQSSTPDGGFIERGRQRRMVGAAIKLGENRRLSMARLTAGILE